MKQVLAMTKFYLLNRLALNVFREDHLIMKVFISLHATLPLHYPVFFSNQHQSVSQEKFRKTIGISKIYHKLKIKKKLKLILLISNYINL